jgi:DNA processing protein
MNNTDEQIIYLLALNMIPGIGSITAKKLIAYCGSAKSVFHEKESVLQKIPGIGAKTSANLSKQNILKQAEKELRLMENLNIKALCFLDKDYPYRLKQCEDGPLLLFKRGRAKLNQARVVAIVGTRNITSYGLEKCHALVEDLAPLQPLVISGLAYGTDAAAHRSALRNNLITAAVLGHGLDRIYPSLHASLAREIEKQGALLSEFPAGTLPDRENFPKRNRIIAGLCDAVIVTEAAITGGALITANIANTYNRDVFALPGRTTDLYSKGCNLLIKSNKAHLFESAADVQYIMNWDSETAKKPGRQAVLFETLTEEEKKLHALLSELQEASIDQIVQSIGMNLGKASQVLLNMECRGLVSTLPGKMYRLK